MTTEMAAAIAALINAQNQLTTEYSAARVLSASDNYIVRMNEGQELIGVVEVKRVQWYQCELLHLSVRPDAQGRGVGKSLVEEAETFARALGARIAQCTIRDGNASSDAVFSKRGFAATLTFRNAQTGNNVRVYQKAL